MPSRSLLASLVALVLCACAGPPSSSPGASRQDELVMNGRCRCPGDAYCVQHVAPGVAAAPISCVPATGGCIALSNSVRRCWGSPQTMGLCLCAGSSTETQAAN
jgi:hypothetical protein